MARLNYDGMDIFDTYWIWWVGCIIVIELCGVLLQFWASFRISSCWLLSEEAVGCAE